MRIAGALAWLLFSVYVCWATRPVEWPVLEVEPVIAHPGIMSSLYRNRMGQIQALVDANVPVMSAKGLQIQQAGRTITFGAGRLPQEIRDFHFIMDSDYPVLLFTEANCFDVPADRECRTGVPKGLDRNGYPDGCIEVGR